jgi:hypothetical protein
MPRPSLIRTMTAAAVIVASALLTGTGASASTDTTPPTAPRLVYATGYQCLTLIVGVQRSTDNVTPQTDLRYEVFANGTSIGVMTDNGGYSGVYSILTLREVGPNQVAVRAIDLAGNRSALSNAFTATGHFTLTNPDCTR